MADPLASWLPCAARAAILDFVRLITEAVNVIFGAGLELRQWRGSTEVQDVYDRIMALMGA
jgi:hypothetical protein